MSENIASSEKSERTHFLAGEELGNILFWSFALSRGNANLQKYFFAYIAFKEPTWELVGDTGLPENRDPEAYQLVKGKLEKMMDSMRHVRREETVIRNAYNEEFEVFEQELRFQKLYSRAEILRHVFTHYIGTDMKYLDVDSAGTRRMKFDDTTRIQDQKGFFDFKRSFLYDYTISGKKLPPAAPPVFHALFEDLKEYIVSGEYQREALPDDIKGWEKICAKTRAVSEEKV